MKKSLNEEISRIKGMMKKIDEYEFDDFDTQISPEEFSQDPEIDLSSPEKESNSLRKKESYYIDDKGIWMGGDTSFKGRQDLDSDPDYEDDLDVTDIDSLYNKYPDSWKHYTRADLSPERRKHVMRILQGKDNPVRVKRLKSSVERDDYDERLERNYGVEDDDRPLRDKF
jgi:hypothetical protein